MTYRLWVNEERTVLVRVWEDGSVEVATRDASDHTWGPPRYLYEEVIPWPNASPPSSSLSPPSS